MPKDGLSPHQAGVLDAVFILPPAAPPYRPQGFRCL